MCSTQTHAYTHKALRGKHNVLYRHKEIASFGTDINLAKTKYNLKLIHNMEWFCNINVRVYLITLVFICMYTLQHQVINMQAENKFFSECVHGYLCFCEIVKKDKIKDA